MKFLEKDSQTQSSAPATTAPARAPDDPPTPALAPKDPPPPARAPQDALADAAGFRHRRARSAEARIVSLVPSLTELLFDLGLGASVVGRTAYCVHPPEVKGVPRVGGTKTVDLDRLRRLAPTHVVVNVDETPRAVADALTAEGWIVVVTHPVRPEDNLGLYRLLGGLFGREAEARALGERFEAAAAALAETAATVPPRRVLYLIWKKPWMTVSRETYISRTLAAAALNTLPEVSTHRYPPVDLDPALLGAVDLVLFSSEPFPFRERHVAEFRAAFPAHAAKARGIDGEMVSWYGSRAIAGLGYLAEFVRRSA